MLDRIRVNRSHLIGGAVTAAALVGSALLLGRLYDPRAPWTTATPTPVITIVDPTPLPTVSTTLVVHVSGAVRNPGVYSLESGKRVKDAIEAAGGVVGGADADSLNLAALVKDGQHVVVPQAMAVTPRPAGTADPPGSKPINLNSASAAELETLPGVGPVTAARIISYREESGGFTSVDQLRDLKLVNQSRFATQSRLLLTWTDRDAAKQ